MSELHIHPFAPVWDEQSEILILGSFPSVKSRELGFYYGNPNNRFWQVLEAVFKEPVPHDIEGRRTFLIEHHLALWDALASCEIIGSSDASIKNPVPNNLNDILQTAPIKHIFANGKLASRIIRTYHADLVCEKLHTLPSTSPANASWSLPRLVEVWSQAIML